jgi:hypothetical protein
MDGTDPFRVGIVGSRRRNSYKDRGYVFRIVDGLLCAFRGKRPVVVVSGGAAGPDSFAEEAADVLGAGKLIHRIEPVVPFDLAEFTRRAFERNGWIVRDSDVVFALVHESRTGGTENTISHAEKAGRTTYLVHGDGRTERIV